MRLLVTLFSTLALILLARAEEEARQCQFPDFERCDFFIQGLTYLPTESIRDQSFVSLRHASSQRLLPPFPDMVGKFPEEKFLGQNQAHMSSLVSKKQLEEGQLFTNAFLRPQSLFGHIFPDLHKQVYFFPFCCPLKEETEASIRTKIASMVEEGFFASWWQDATTDLVERLFFEYNVFGACSESPNVEAYFTLARDWFKALNAANAIFEDAGVAQGININHSVNNVRSMIREILDVQVALQCIWDKDKNKSLLHQVWFCREKDGRLIDCPLQTQAEESCTRQVKSLDSGKNEILDFSIPSWKDVTPTSVKEDL